MQPRKSGSPRGPSRRRGRLRRCPRTGCRGPQARPSHRVRPITPGRPRRSPVFSESKGPQPQAPGLDGGAGSCAGPRLRGRLGGGLAPCPVGDATATDLPGLRAWRRNSSESLPRLSGFSRTASRPAHAAHRSARPRPDPARGRGTRPPGAVEATARVPCGPRARRQHWDDAVVLPRDCAVTVLSLSLSLSLSGTGTRSMRTAGTAPAPFAVEKAVVVQQSSESCSEPAADGWRGVFNAVRTVRAARLDASTLRSRESCSESAAIAVGSQRAPHGTRRPSRRRRAVVGPPSAVSGGSTLRSGRGRAGERRRPAAGPSPSAAHARPGPPSGACDDGCRHRRRRRGDPDACEMAGARSVPHPDVRRLF